MKKFMNKINMTWSDNMERINHHLGNVVVYPEENNLCLGFCDFESACNRRDMSREELKIQQMNEFKRMRDEQILMEACARTLLISWGAYTSSCFNYGAITLEKTPMVEGFVKGYESKSKKISNKIESHRLEEIVSLLHQSAALLTT